MSAKRKSPQSGNLLLRFKPLPAQRQFLLSRDPFLAYVGGYGSGKTYALCHKAILLSAENQGLPGMIIAPTYPMLDDVVIRTMCEILDRHKISYKFHRTRNSLSTAWGGEIWFRSADNPDSLRGPNLPWVGLDEMSYIDRQAWEVAVSRVRHPRARCRQVFGVTTPEGFNWVYEAFVENRKPGHSIIFADTRENKYLPSDYIERLLASFDADGIKQYVQGSFVANSSGRIYKHFDPAIHMKKYNPLIADSESSAEQNSALLNPSLPLCIACDFNVDPCIWLALQHYRGHVYVADEIVQRNTTTQEMIEETCRRGYRDHPAGVIVYGDPAGHARSTVGAGSDYQLLRDAGLDQQRVPRHHAPVRDRVNAVNARLRNSSGKSRLTIHPNCAALRRDLLRVRYQPGTATIDKTADRDLTHASDALGYFMVAEYPIIRGTRGPESIWNVLKR